MRDERRKEERSKQDQTNNKAKQHSTPKATSRSLTLAILLVFTPYLLNAVDSEKFPHPFSCPCSTEAVGIAHKPPRSL